MNAFISQSVNPTTTCPDPRKHVKYSYGMILGAEDLTQEFAYLSNRDQWLARDTIGYGTVCGLKLDKVVRDVSRGPEISVSPGVALTPRGQLVRVGSTQCASLNAWLRSTPVRNLLGADATSPAGNATVYVVLCYRACPVDPLPVPGEPCRCDSEATAPSRTMDDYCLELSLTPPPQAEEDAIRGFVEILCHFRPTADPTAALSLEQFLELLRAAATSAEFGSPPQTSLEFHLDSPPREWFIPQAGLCEYLRAALRLWITEFRPRCQVQWPETAAACNCGGGCGCGCNKEAQAPDPAERRECLLLGQIDVQLAFGTAPDLTSVTFNESRRPLLASLRLLQEWMLCGCHCGGGCSSFQTFATIFALDAQTLRIWLHYPEPLDLEAAAVTLLLDDLPGPAFTLLPVQTGSDPSAGPDLNVFDLHLGDSPVTALGHQQCFTVRLNTSVIFDRGSPGAPISEQLRASQSCYPDFSDGVASIFGVVDLPSAVAATLAGDVIGPANANSLAAIQNVPLNVPGPLPDGVVLGHDSNQWHAVPLPQRGVITPSLITFPSGGSAGGAGTMDYARADHVHPTTALPSVPQPSSVLPVAETFGNPGSAGSIATTEYSRADHVHPMPTVSFPDPYRVTTGSIRFQGVDPARIIFSPEIPHAQPPESILMIRLGVEIAFNDASVTRRLENMDTLPIGSDPGPFMVALYTAGTDTFRVALRPGTQMQEVVVRWWAVPATEEEGEVVVPPDFREIPTKILLTLIPPEGITLSALAKALPSDDAALDTALKKLRKSKQIRIANNRITPV